MGDQIKYFQDRGFEVHIACSNDEKLFEYQKKWEFVVFPLNIRRSISIFSDLKSIYKLTRYIKKNKFDIVVGHTPKGGLIASISSWLNGTHKRVYFIHGLMFETKNYFTGGIFRCIEKLVCALSTDVVCVSKSVSDKVISCGISDHVKVFSPNPGSCNGVDSIKKFNPLNISQSLLKELKNKFNISDHTKVVGYIGRLSKDKGINELVYAWELLRCDPLYNNTILILCGPDDDRDGLDFNTRFKISSNKSIIKVGFVEETELIYSLFDIFILPSFREGFPTVVLEASSMGLPIITTRSTGCVDSIVDNYTGIYTPITPEGILASIKYYLQNPSIAKSHGINGKKHISKYFAQNIIWEQLYKSIYL